MKTPILKVINLLTKETWISELCERDPMDVELILKEWTSFTFDNEFIAVNAHESNAGWFAVIGLHGEPARITDDNCVWFDMKKVN